MTLSISDPSLATKLKRRSLVFYLTIYFKRDINILESKKLNYMAEIPQGNHRQSTLPPSGGHITWELPGRIVRSFIRELRGGQSQGVDQPSGPSTDSTEPTLTTDHPNSAVEHPKIGPDSTSPGSLSKPGEYTTEQWARSNEFRGKESHEY